jgi:hypothetical protein
MRGLAVLSVLAAAGAFPLGNAAGAAAIFAGPQSDPVFSVIAPELSTAMFPNQRLELVPVPGAEAALDRAAADPASLAITDLATMLDYARRKGLAADRLEFQAVAGRRCLLGFTQRGGWIRNLADLAAAGTAPRPTIGLPDGEAEAALALLRRFDSGLDNAQTVTAPLADLVARAAKGAIDLVLVEVNPEFDAALVERLADDDRLARIPFVTRLLSRAAADRNSGFVMVPVRTDSGLLPWSRAPDVTLCTPIGAVLRNDAPALLRETLGRAAPAVAATLHTTLTDRTMKAARSALGDVMSTVKSLLDRF